MRGVGLSTLDAVDTYSRIPYLAVNASVFEILVVDNEHTIHRITNPIKTIHKVPFA